MYKTIINGETTDIRVGDSYVHRELGLGVIVNINDNPKSLHPINYYHGYL